VTPLFAVLADLIMTAIWPLAAHAGLRYYNGLLFMTAGLLIGLGLISPFLFRGGRWRRLFSRDAAPSLMAAGFLSGLATAIYIAALAYTTPVNAVIVAQIEVLYSAILSARFLGERPTWKQTAASVLVVAGTAIIVLKDLRSPRWRGDLMVLATPWMYQVSHVFLKKLPRDLDAVTLSGGRIVYGLLMALPLSAVVLWRGAAWSWEPAALRLLFLQGAFMSSLNFFLWYYAIRGMPLSKATTILLSYPALTFVFSWGLGFETIRVFQLAGLACTFAGAAWTARLSLGSGSELVAETSA
jgi:drug/metabolite transporter (DMT)-like permease